MLLMYVVGMVLELEAEEVRAHVVVESCSPEVVIARRP
jgi:hypothetical protein